MTREELNNLIEQWENAKVDFKRQWYWNDNMPNNIKETNKNELVKDLIALTNGDVYSTDKRAYLIVGIDDNTREIYNFDKSAILPLDKLKQQLFTLLNNYAQPEFLALDIELVDEVLIISIPPRGSLISLSKDLKLKNNNTDKKGTTYYRVGEDIRVASSEVVGEFEKAFGHDKNINGKKIETNQNFKYTVSKQLTIKLGKSTIIGREKELKEIDKQLKFSNTLLIKGIGGVGKSTIVSNYLHRHKEEYAYYGFFEGLESFESELEGAFKLEIKEGQDRLDRVLRELIELEPMSMKLLVIDDIKEIKENQEKLKKILALKHNGYRVILTSRFKVKNINIYSLSVLDPQDAQKLFVDNYKTEELEKVNKIIEYLDYHPLFIELIAKTINNEAYTLNEIIEQLELAELDRIEFVDEEDGDLISFNINLQKLFEIQKKTLKDEYLLLLKQLAVLPSIDIEFNLLEKILKIKNLKGKLTFLVNNGWLIQNSQCYKVHQLIKEYLLINHLPLFADVEKLFIYFYEIIKDINQENIKYHKNEIYYFDSIYDYFIRLSNKPISRLSTISNVLNSKYLRRMIFNIHFTINSDESNILNIVGRQKKIYNQVFEFQEQLAFMYELLGNYKKALYLYQDIINIHREFTGKYHFIMASKYHNVARNYRKLHDLDNALVFFKKALKITEKKFGLKHIRTANHYNSLGVVYSKMNEYEFALKFHKKSFNIKKELLGVNHLDAATSLSNIGEVYSIIGLYKESEILQNKALEIRIKLLGNIHTKIADSYNNLAGLYHKMEIYDKAEKLFIVALNIYEEILGINHHNTIIVNNNLGGLYSSIGDIEKAHFYLNKALDISQSIYGDKHLFSASSHLLLARFYFDNKDFEKAYSFYQEALNIRIPYINKDSHLISDIEKELQIVRKKLKQ